MMTNHKIERLLQFLASNYCDSKTEEAIILSDKNWEKAAKIFETTPETLKTHIYESYINLGLEQADGMFRMGLLPDFSD